MALMKPKRPNRIKRWRRWIVRIGVVAFLLGGGGVFWLIQPPQLRWLVIQALEYATGATIRLHTAQWQWGEGIYLNGLELSVPDIPHGQIFTADQIHIDPSLLWLLTGSLQADAVVLVRPTLYLTEDRATGQYLLQQLTQTTGPDSPFKRFINVPQVIVRQGQIVFREIHDGTLRDLDTLKLEGKLIASHEKRGAYRFSLHRVAQPSQTQPTLHGAFDLDESSFEVALDGFHFEQPQRYFLRHELRSWWDRLAPEGAFSTLELAYHPDRGWTVQLALDHASLNIPVENFLPRMTDVSGRLRVVGHQLILDNLNGIVEGLRYRITGNVADLREKENARFTIHGVTDWFEVRPDLDFIDRLPQIARKYYDRFHPAGQFKVEVECQRQQVDGTIEIAGQIHIRNATGVFDKFPYPVHDVAGLLSFSRDAIVIEQLSGRGSSGAVFTVETGRIAPPGDDGAVQMRIVGQNIAIDDVLRNALKPQDHRAMDAFLDEQQLTLLKSQVSSLKSFELGGVIQRAVLEIDRPQGRSVKAHIRNTLDVEGLGILYRRWPYPLTATSGQISITRSGVAVDVQLHGPSGATGHLMGQLNRNDEGAMSPDLRLEDASIPIDALLIASLPQPQNQQLADLQLGGTLQGGGRIWQPPQPPQAPATFRFDLQWIDGRAAPYDGLFVFDSLTGGVSVQPHQLRLNQLRATFDQNAWLVADGVVNFDDPFSLHLTLEGETPQLGPTVHALLGGPARSMIDALQLDGGFRLTQAKLDRDPQQQSFTATLELMDVSMQLGVPVTQLHGQLNLATSQRTDQRRPNLRLDLKVDQLRAAERKIERMDISLHSTEDGQPWIIEEFVGSIYGGMAVGQGQIEPWEPGKPGGYEFKLALTNVALGPFLDPQMKSEEQEHTDDGFLSASLRVKATFGQPDTRQGRGAVEIEDAQLFNRPISLALLQAINLTLPTDRSLDHASARYLIDGDRVYFDTIRLDAPSLVISGTGTMDYPTGNLQFDMVTRNPTLPNLGSVGEVINVFKDELMAIRITGTLIQPKAKTISFQGIRRSWNQLFSEKAAGGRRQGSGVRD